MRSSGSRPRRARRRLKDFPVCLQLEGKPVVVVGAGARAARRIRSLVHAGARVIVIDRDAEASVARLAAAGKLDWRRRAFRASDVGRALVVFAATDSLEANRAVARAARRKHLLVNTADDPEFCDFTMPAVTRQGALTVAVSTGGTSARLAQGVRDRIAKLLGGQRIDR